MFDPFQLFRRYAATLARCGVDPPPDGREYDAEQTGVDECLAPAPSDQFHAKPKGWRSQDDTDRGRRVDPANGISAFFLRKPFAAGPHHCWKMPRFAHAEDHTGRHESRDRRSKAMRGMPDRPDRNGDRIADFRPHLVDQPSHEKEPGGIGKLESSYDVAIVILAPAKLLRKLGLEQAQHGAVDVVDRGRQKQQRNYQPATTTNCRPDARYAGHGVADGCAAHTALSGSNAGTAVHSIARSSPNMARACCPCLIG